MAPRARIAAGALALIIAAGTAAIAVQSLRAALIALPAGAIVEAIRNGNPISQQARIEASVRSLGAGAIIERGRYFTDAALAASSLPRGSQYAALPATSLASVVDQALSAVPASPHNWVRLAGLRLARGDQAGARRALDISLLLGRYVPGLTVPRLRVLLRYRLLTNDPSLLPAMEEQVRIAARTEPGQLARFADGGAAEGLAQRVLAQDFALYQSYLKALISNRAAHKAEKVAAK